MPLFIFFLFILLWFRASAVETAHSAVVSTFRQLYEFFIYKSSDLANTHWTAYYGCYKLYVEGDLQISFSCSPLSIYGFIRASLPKGLVYNSKTRSIRVLLIGFEPATEIQSLTSSHTTTPVKSLTRRGFRRIGVEGLMILPGNPVNQKRIPSEGKRREEGALVSKTPSPEGVT